MIDQLSRCLNKILFKNDASDLVFVQKFVAQICNFSKKCLLDDLNLRAKSEYFAFNILILNKIEEILVELLTNCLSINQPFIFADLWLNICVPYIQKIFSKYRKSSLNKMGKKCSKAKHSKPDLNFDNQDQIRASFQFILASSKKLLSNNESGELEIMSERENTTRKISAIKFELDLRIIKKLLDLIQKLFEVYNRKNSDLTKSLEFLKVEKCLKKEHDYLIGSFTESDAFQDIETCRAALNSKEEQDGLNMIAISLFYHSTKSIFNPKLDRNELNKVLVLNLYEQYFSLNQILFTPFKFLVLNRSIDLNLKSMIIKSLCEMVECNSMNLRSSWNSIFNIINKLDLNKEISDRRNCMNESENDVSASDADSISDADDDESKRSTNSSRTESSSSSTSSSSPSDSQNNKLDLMNAGFKFDSDRMRQNSLIDIFNIYLSLTESSDQILANGAFSFVKCITCYLQYKTNIDLEKTFLLSHKAEDYSHLSDNVKNSLLNESENLDDDVDLFLSANDYLLQEKHYNYTSNYDHLVELSEANDSNSPIKPFLICIEKFFKILIKSNSIFCIYLGRILSSFGSRNFFKFNKFKYFENLIFLNLRANRVAKTS
jgi:hypothetical protein